MRERNCAARAKLTRGPHDPPQRLLRRRNRQEYDFRNRQMKNTAKYVAIASSTAVFLVLLIYLAYRYDGRATPLQDQNGDPILPMPFHSAGFDGSIKIVEASDLLREFQHDKVNARSKYGPDMRVWVNGTVTDISGPTVILEGPPGICCVYMSNMEISRLSVGRKATIEGFLRASNHSVEVFRPWKKRV